MDPDADPARKGALVELAGSSGSQGSQPPFQEIDMAKLKAAERKKLPAKDFGEPKARKYPMEDKAHARNAKSRASELEKKGKLSPAEKSKIDRKADRKLGKKEK
jgi:hypothetical protein